jgi:ABC-type antimicrobial peptide transport system permease subunit
MDMLNEPLYLWNTPIMPNSDDFEILGRLEKDFEFIRYALNLFVGVEPQKSMFCILHHGKRKSAGFYRNISGVWCYKDFHDGKIYSILDLLLKYLNISRDKEKLFKKAFASYLVRTFSSNREKEINIVRLLRNRSENLARVYLLIASLNSSLGEHFLSVRSLSWILRLRDITKANRLLNYLCLLGVLEKFKRGYGKAYEYKVRENINLEELEKELESTKEIDIYKLSKEKALEFFDKEKVEKIYLRENNKVE